MILSGFNGFIGNDIIKQQLSISLVASKQRNMAPPHMLFAGQAGCGKTSLSRLVAGIMRTSTIEVPAESLKTYPDVERVLSGLSRQGYDWQGQKIGPTCPGVIFLDEIHNLPLKGQEYLGISMEYFQMISEEVRFKKTTKHIKWVPQFTLIGATTDVGKLSKPFRDKFKLIFQFELYSLEEMSTICVNYIHSHGLEVKDVVVEEIVKRSRGIPRIGKSFCDRAIELATLFREKIISRQMIDRVFSLLRIDDDGLSMLDKKILTSLYEAGCPVGIENLSIITAEPKDNVSQVAEPFLIRNGLIIRTPTGRLITEKGIQLLIKNKYIIPYSNR